MSPSLGTCFSRSRETGWLPVSLAVVPVLVPDAGAGVGFVVQVRLEVWMRWEEEEAACLQSGRCAAPRQKQPRCSAVGRKSPVPVPSSHSLVASRDRWVWRLEWERVRSSDGEKRREKSVKQKKKRKKKEEKEKKRFVSQIASVVVDRQGVQVLTVWEVEQPFVRVGSRWKCVV